MIELGIFAQKGVKVSHNKRTSKMEAVRIDHCERVTLLMKQHIGAACIPCVAPGDRVLAGQVVGDTSFEPSAPVHASISGTVQDIELIRLPSGEDVKAVVVESDGRMEHIEYAPPVVNSPEEFFVAVWASGLVGLGGAGFPAHVKLRGSFGKANILLVNASECEPNITVDHREVLDASLDIIEGMKLICRWLDIPEAIVGIEKNKADAIALLKVFCAEHSTPQLRMRVKALKSRYPQGADKVFIRSLTRRVVPLGQLPGSVSVLSMNVGSVSFIGRYMQTGRPLISRTVTVDGDAVPRPMNVRVPVGIALRELCAFCGAEHARPAKIILGGPMMGGASPDLNAVISKCNNALLLFSERQAHLKPETACIRCGSCVTACPMRLMPLHLEKAYYARDVEALNKLNATGCMECGCCSFACPAGRELVQRIRMGKRVCRAAEGSKT